jgi:hypothetical protein
LSIEGGNRHADVLFLAAGVGEAEVNETDFLFFDHLDYVLGGHVKCWKSIPNAVQQPDSS